MTASTTDKLQEARERLAKLSPPIDDEFRAKLSRTLDGLTGVDPNHADRIRRRLDARLVSSAYELQDELDATVIDVPPVQPSPSPQEAAPVKPKRMKKGKPGRPSQDVVAEDTLELWESGRFKTKKALAKHLDVEPPTVTKRIQRAKRNRLKK